MFAPSSKPQLEMEEKKKNGTKYAGEIFDENKQCELVFGPGSTICGYMPPCTRLWCSLPDEKEQGCKTQHMPWADGTPCGEGRWCMKAKCIERSRKEAVRRDGSWGEWQR